MKKLNGTVFTAFWTHRFGEPVNFNSFGDPDIEQIEFVDAIERFIEVFKYKRTPDKSGKTHRVTFAVPKSSHDLNLVIQFIQESIQRSTLQPLNVATPRGNMCPTTFSAFRTPF